MLTCPECGSERIETSRSQTICKKCGTVIDDGRYSGARIV